MDIFSVRGKVVVVTGGMGRLGRNFCAELHARHAQVVILDREIAAEGIDRDLCYMVCDITDKSSLASCLADVEERFGTPDGLVNCAAIDSPPDASAAENGPFEEYPEDSWERVLSVNAKGTFLACQVFGGAMADAGRGSIVNIGSIYGLVAPDQGLYSYRRERGEVFYKPVAYSASKSAILNLSRYLATYWGECNVRVNTVTLGGVFDHQDREFLDAYTRKVPLGRMARESEYNGLVVFLLSDAASYITGSNLIADGGFTAW